MGRAAGAEAEPGTPGCPHRRGPRSCGAAARRSATATRDDTPWSSAISTMPGHYRTTEHHRVSRNGNSGPVLSLPCRSMFSVVRIPPAGRRQKGAEMARTKPIHFERQGLTRHALKPEVRARRAREQSQFGEGTGPRMGRITRREKGSDRGRRPWRLERNSPRAGLVGRAEQWPWSSPAAGAAAAGPRLDPGPVPHSLMSPWGTPNRAGRFVPYCKAGPRAALPIAP
jgi:hypothetical protein